MLFRIAVILGIPAAIVGTLAAAATVGMIGRPITAELIQPVRGDQLQNARIIVREMRKRDHSPALIMAALTNSWAESLWRNKAISPPPEDSVGLFQLNSAPRAAGEGMTRQQRFDPVINTNRILDVLDEDGAAVFRAEMLGASAAEMAALFSRDIERPADEAGAMAHRREVAEQLFGDAARKPGPLVALPASLLGA